MNNLADFFGPKAKEARAKRKLESSKEPEAKPKAKKQRAVIIDDEDDDIVETTAPEAKEEKKPTPASLKKANPKATKKTPAKQSKPTKAEPNSSGGLALDVLAQIPDCELPESTEPVDKRAFFAKKLQLESQVTDDDFKKPVGKPGCLAGLTIVFTGYLPHLNREDCEELAQRYGAKVTKSISGKTTLVVLGKDAGPSKVNKIKQHKIRHLDEDGFCKLIEGAPEDGGDSELAHKALEKQRLEEKRAREAAEEEIRESEEKERAKRRKLAAKQTNEPHSSVDKYVKSEDRPDDEKLWTVKHAPQKLSQICGNKGQVQKLIKWLGEWDQNKKSKFKYSGLSFPAVLISGPPGIGKTTAAHIVCKELGYDVIEKNASDVRSKKLLNATIGDILDNEGIAGFFDKSKSQKSHRICLIMDEVDGMSSGDLGGVGALSAFCRKTSIPIILICNDKSLPKMRPFDRVTLDMPFRRPDATAIKSRLLTICLREKIKVPPQIIDRLVEYTKNDIRQIINLLSTVSKTTPEINESNYKEAVKGWEKNVAMKTFDIAGRYLSSGIWASSSNVTLNQKIEYYFDDHSFVPLMIHENYMSTMPARSHGDRLESLELVAKAADSISEGDLVDAKIHSAEQLWSLMPLHAVMSSVRPSSLVNGQITGRINFTSFLGNLSKGNKYNRLLTDLNYHTKLRTLTNKSELRMNYLNVLAKKLADPILNNGGDGISEVIAILDEYYLTKEDWEYVLDLGVGKNPYKLEAVMKRIPTQVKSSFTRIYNNSTHPVAIYHVGTAGASKGGISADKPDFDDAVNEDNDGANADDDEGDDEDEGDIKKDKLIKQKKATTKKPAKAKTTKKKATATRKKK